MSESAVRSVAAHASSSVWQPVPVARVMVGDRAREVHPDHVAALRRSFGRLGGHLQLQPIVLDERWVLIDGIHRLEAAKQSGWTHIGALVVEGVRPGELPLLALEANRVRRNLSVLELEEAWRIHYAPGLREAASARRLSALRRGRRTSASPRGSIDVPRTGPPILGVSNNEDGSASESIGRAAKRITGHSLDTLNKVAQIRELSQSSTVPEEQRKAAELGLRRLATPGVSVEPVYRALRNLQRRTTDREGSALSERESADQSSVERVLFDTSLLADQLRGPLSDRLVSAARANEANLEMLRATRVSLARSLALVVAAECRVESDPLRALARIGREVSRLLSRVSYSQLSAVERERSRE